jgi:phosphate transport system substrate-binding protein
MNSKIKPLIIGVGILAVAGVIAAIVAPLAGSKQQAPQVIRVDGSSTVFPITDAIAKNYNQENKRGIEVKVDISGTGGGFRKFCAGETDISNASRPISQAEMEACKQAGIAYIELRV